MELTNGNNNSFTLTLVGYEFPHLVNIEYDSDWLNVKIEVGHERGRWSAIDPALLTYEVAELIDWLRAVNAGNYDKRSLEFLEPCLSFHLAPDEAPHNLVVELGHEFRPPWATGDPFDPHQIAYSLQGLDLLGAAESLENQLRRFPQRTER